MWCNSALRRPCYDLHLQNLVFRSKFSASYLDSGVDINAGSALVESIKPLAKSTSRPGCMSELGGFGALFDLCAAGYKDPILVSGTDGVGTKLKVMVQTVS